MGILKSLLPDNTIHRFHLHSRGGDYTGCVHDRAGILVAVLELCTPQRDPWMYPDNKMRNLLASLCIIFMKTNITGSIKPAILHGLAMVKLIKKERKGAKVSLKVWDSLAMTVVQWAYEWVYSTSAGLLLRKRDRFFKEGKRDSFPQKSSISAYL